MPSSVRDSRRGARIVVDQRDVNVTFFQLDCHRAVMWMSCNVGRAAP
ncbi:protein of unknown function (plasmid) [Cupriavidus taiwanensis]|uniref:Uncharacterized protein n=1 Tax=Cupriavidus taiwanensis TaxID=164546 RepID=A0A9Q7V077_9BURK|nr:protein of unknown function [Cupriavidus taiwanensis]